MTSVTIELPDALAEEARKRGLLSSEILAPVLSEMLRLKSGAELRDLFASRPGRAGRRSAPQRGLWPLVRW